jgi:hypothetical protein
MSIALFVDFDLNQLFLNALAPEGSLNKIETI